MRARGLVDVLIPRGGAGLIRSVVEESTVPVIETGVGNCHVYVDAPPTSTRRSRSWSTPRPTAPASATPPSRCWCTPTSPTAFLPAGRRGPAGGGRDDPRRRRRSRRTTAWCRPPTRTAGRSTSPSTSPRAVVPDLDEAIAPHPPLLQPAHRRDRHRATRRAARRFVAEVDSAAVLVNASTRFTDGGRVRLRRRDRDQHPEAARARPDGAAGDDLDQVRRHRGRPRALSPAPPSSELSRIQTIEVTGLWASIAPSRHHCSSCWPRCLMFGAGREHS